MLSGRKDRRELPETLRTNRNKLCRTAGSGRGKKKGFGFGGFSLTSLAGSTKPGNWDHGRK